MINIVYLLGAGRSGTTLIATVLNSHPDITTVGEMHQFVEHIRDNKKCSCGCGLHQCEYWSPILKTLNIEPTELGKIQNIIEQKEDHKNILKLIFQKRPDNTYLSIQNKVFKAINSQYNKSWVLDSSKYIARYLLLKRSDQLNIKGVYVVRDVRGVINSFVKKVQTPKTPLATIVYYSLINVMGQLVCSFDKRILKIKYEDFVENPKKTLTKIYTHVFNEKEEVDLPSNFAMPHIIGGNRMKTNRQVTINKDLKWKQSISRSKQISYYLLTLPLMLLNKYKP